MNDIEILNMALPPNPGREWKDVPGFEGRYVASDDGHIGSLSRVVRSGLLRSRKVRTRVMKPIIRKKQTGAVISCCVHLVQEDGPTLSANIGRVVLVAFKGDAPGLVASFRDGNPANTRLENLHWTTPAEIGRAAINGGYGEILRDRATLTRWGAHIAGGGE